MVVTMEEKYLVYVVAIQRIISLPMHGKEPKKALIAKEAAHNDVYGKYNTH